MNFSFLKFDSNEILSSPDSKEVSQEHTNTVRQLIINRLSNKFRPNSDVPMALNINPNPQISISEELVDRVVQPLPEIENETRELKAKRLGIKFFNAITEKTLLPFILGDTDENVPDINDIVLQRLLEINDAFSFRTEWLEELQFAYLTGDTRRLDKLIQDQNAPGKQIFNGFEDLAIFYGTMLLNSDRSNKLSETAESPLSIINRSGIRLHPSLLKTDRSYLNLVKMNLAQMMIFPFVAINLPPKIGLTLAVTEVLASTGLGIIHSLRLYEQNHERKNTLRATLAQSLLNYLTTDLNTGKKGINRFSRDPQ